MLGAAQPAAATDQRDVRQPAGHRRRRRREPAVLGRRRRDPGATRTPGQLGQDVVVQLGTNGTVDPGDFDRMMDDPAATVKKVVIVNAKVPRPWEEQVNDTLAAGVKKYKNAVLLDWHSYGGEHPEFFYDDGIHLRPEGAAAYAQLRRPRRLQGAAGCVALTPVPDRPGLRVPSWEAHMRSFSPHARSPSSLTHRHRRHRRRRLPRRADPGHRRDRHRAPLHGQAGRRAERARPAVDRVLGRRHHRAGRRSACQGRETHHQHQRGAQVGDQRGDRHRGPDRSGPTTASTSARCSGRSSPTSRRGGSSRAARPSPSSS